MKYIDTSKNYQRLFHFDGMYFLMNDLWMAWYKHFNAVVTAINDNCYMWLPKESLDARLEEGAEFFADTKRFEEYYHSHVIFLDSLKAVFRSDIRERDLLTLENVKKFLELCRQQLSYFYKTDFLFTDKAYEISELNPTVKENLMKNYVLKERSRVEIFNDGWFKENSQLKQMIRKLSHQFDISEKDLEQYGVDDIYALFEGKKVDEQSIQDRRDARIICGEHGVMKTYFGLDVQDDIRALLEQTGEEAPKEVEALKGITANKGKVVGKVKVIISDPKTIDAIHKEMEEMEEGDILVAETTSPEFMPACRKAGAILANQGGLLSHAAVVAREFGIPCIVGLRYATKVLKDGDRVEVDATRGIVRKLSQT